MDGYEPADAVAWSVVVKGNATEISEMQESIRALRLPIFPWHDGPKLRFVRIEPTGVTGRRFHVPGGYREAPVDPTEHAKRVGIQGSATPHGWLKPSRTVPHEAPT